MKKNIIRIVQSILFCFFCLFIGIGQVLGEGEINQEDLEEIMRQSLISTNMSVNVPQITGQDWALKNGGWSTYGIKSIRITIINSSGNKIANSKTLEYKTLNTMDGSTNSTLGISSRNTPHFYNKYIGNSEVDATRKAVYSNAYNFSKYDSVSEYNNSSPTYLKSGLSIGEVKQYFVDLADGKQNDDVINEIFQQHNVTREPQTPYYVLIEPVSTYIIGSDNVKYTVLELRGVKGQDKSSHYDQMIETNKQIKEEYNKIAGFSNGEAYLTEIGGTSGLTQLQKNYLDGIKKISKKQISICGYVEPTCKGSGEQYYKCIDMKKAYNLLCNDRYVLSDEKTWGNDPLTSNYIRTNVYTYLTGYIKNVKEEYNKYEKALAEIKYNTELSLMSVAYFTGTPIEAQKFSQKFKTDSNVKSILNNYCNGTSILKNIGCDNYIKALNFSGGDTLVEYRLLLLQDKSYDEEQFYKWVGYDDANNCMGKEASAGCGLMMAKITEKTFYANTCMIKDKPNAIRYQTIQIDSETIEEIDCCDFLNYVNENITSAGTQQLYKNSGFRTQAEFEAGAWYQTNCIDPTPPPPNSYCTINDITLAKAAQCQTTQNPVFGCYFSNTKWVQKCCNPIEYDQSTQNQFKAQGGFEQYLKDNHADKYGMCYTQPNTCIYDIKSACPNCDNNSNGEVYDTVNGFNTTDSLDGRNLECIFKNPDYNTSELSNDYCSVYCTESVSYEFPDNFSVEAGRYITVGNGGHFSPIKITGKKVCRIQEILEDKYRDELEEANENVKKAWDDYQIEILRGKNLTEEKNYSSCNYLYDTSHWKACIGPESSNTESATTGKTECDSISSVDILYATSGIRTIDNLSAYNDCKKEWYSTNFTCWPGRPKDSNCNTTAKWENGQAYIECFSTTVSCEKQPDYCESKYSSDTYSKGAQKPSVVGGQCTYYTCANVNTTKKSAYYIKSFNYNGKKYANETTKICADASNVYTTDVSGKYDAYLGAVEARKKIIDQMESCGNIKNSITNNSFEPIINLSYNNSSKYSISSMNLKATPEPSTTDFIEGSITIYENKNIYKCTKEGQTCELTDITPIYRIVGDSVGISLTKIYNYSLPNDSNIYKYTEYSSAISHIEQVENALRIGPHLPVAYDATINDNNISLMVATLGNNNKFNEEICDEYSCEFATYRKLIKKDGGLNVVYRPISLSNPFPGESANGRQTGENWCDGNNCSQFNPLVRNVITSNRGVTTDEIYSKRNPLYTITLTPAKILQIREYNSNTNYGDYNFDCKENGHCHSKFIRGDINGSGFNLISNGILNTNNSCAINATGSRCNEGDEY